MRPLNHSRLNLLHDAEWMSYFNEQKHVLSGAEGAKAQALQAQIDRTGKEVECMVYVL